MIHSGQPFAMGFATGFFLFEFPWVAFYWYAISVAVDAMLRNRENGKSRSTSSAAS